MALDKVLTIILLSIYLQKIDGQSNNLLNNPTLEQNSINQGFPSGTTIKNLKDTLLRNENLRKAPIFNPHNQENLIPLTSIPQKSLGLSSSYTLQQQNLPQLVNQQSPQIQQPELQQQQHLYNLQQLIPETPMIPQTYNFNDEQSSFVPAGIQQTPVLQSLDPYQYANTGNINLQEIPIVTPPIQQVPIQVSQCMPSSNPLVATYATIPATSCGQKPDVVTNLSGNYYVPFAHVSVVDPHGQFLTSIPTLPYTAVVSTSKPTVGKSVVIPYQSQNFGIVENFLDNDDELSLEDEESYFDYDNLTSLLLSLLQPPKKNSKQVKFNNQENPYASFTPYKTHQGSKSSSLKALLPIIVNLIKERKGGCRCGYDCECNRMIKKNIEPQINGGYSKKMDYSLKEEMLQTIDSEEQPLRISREHKKGKKNNKIISKVSSESVENETDYDNLSEEEED